MKAILHLENGKKIPVTIKARHFKQGYLNSGKGKLFKTTWGWIRRLLRRKKGNPFLVNTANIRNQRGGR